MKLSERTYSWYHILSVICIWIIAFQWIDFTVPLWFQATTTLVTVTLLIVGAVELLPLQAGWRWTMKLIVVMASWRVVLVGYGVYTPSGPLYPDQLRDMSLSFHPYIWFSLAAWFLFELILMAVKGKARIMLFLAGHLIVFAALDSFTPYHLWMNVAWIVFAGLSWLAGCHFREYQLKFPQGWGVLKSHPLQIAGNIIVVFACVLLIGTNMPTVSPLLTDPYTAWVNRNSGSGGGEGTVETATSSISTLAPNFEQAVVVSGYSRDDQELGGGFEFSYSPVMSIDSSVRSYWRGETRRLYTGTGWLDYLSEGRNNRGGGGSEEFLLNDPAPKTETMQVVQTITMQNEQIYPILFGGYAIAKVEYLDEESSASFSSSATWYPEEAELRWDPSHVAVLSSSAEPTRLYPRRYAITANIPLIPLEEVREAAYQELYPEGSRDEQYLQVPSDFPERVRLLAEQITSEGDTPYKKMELLQAYLRQNFEYTNKPDISRKQSDDFVDSFLFEIQQGYCDYFSTSMVMMARTLGIPARWVKGYAPGSQPSPETLDRFPERGMAYQVNNADAHSWVELHFGDYGWIPFEPTPGFNAPVLYKQDDSVVAFADIEQPDMSDHEAASGGFMDRVSPQVLRIISMISAAVILVWAVYRFRSSLYFVFMRMRIGHKLSAAEKTVLETMRVVRALRWRGFERSEEETLRETFAQWSAANPNLSSILDDLLQEFELASYSRDAYGEERWRHVRDLSKELFRNTGKRR